jgi:hypothetical protein
MLKRSDLKSDVCDLKQIDVHSKQICFVKRVSDKKHLRDSMLFIWVNAWQKAEMVSPAIVRQYMDSGVMSRYGIINLNDIDLIIEPIRH